MTAAVAERSKVTSWPPVNAHRIGVINWKWPVTVTVTCGLVARLSVTCRPTR